MCPEIKLKLFLFFYNAADFVMEIAINSAVICRADLPGRHRRRLHVPSAFQSPDATVFSVQLIFAAVNRRR